MATDFHERSRKLSKAKRRLLHRRLRGVGTPSNELHALGSTARPAKTPASFAQQRLWFVARTAQTASEYQITTALHLCGRLDVPALIRSMQTIAARHEILRTRYEDDDGILSQVVERDMPLAVAVEDLDGLS